MPSRTPIPSCEKRPCREQPSTRHSCPTATAILETPASFSIAVSGQRRRLPVVRRLLPRSSDRELTTWASGDDHDCKLAVTTSKRQTAEVVAHPPSGDYADATSSLPERRRCLRRQRSSSIPRAGVKGIAASTKWTATRADDAVGILAASLLLSVERRRQSRECRHRGFDVGRATICLLCSRKAVSTSRTPPQSERVLFRESFVRQCCGEVIGGLPNEEEPRVGEEAPTVRSDARIDSRCPHFLGAVRYVARWEMVLVALRAEVCEVKRKTEARRWSASTCPDAAPLCCAARLASHHRVSIRA